MITETLPFPDVLVEGKINLAYVEICTNLQHPTPRQLISEKKLSGRSIDFVNITDVKDLLDTRGGIWTSEIRDFRQIGMELLMVVRITIHAIDGQFSHDGTGVCEVDHGGFGDTFSNAYAQAFRRSAESHGLCRELWRGLEQELVEQNSDQRREQTPTERLFGDRAIAKSLSDLVTAKQLGMIRALAREKTLDAEVDCNNTMGCKTDELSKKAASAYIGYLQEFIPK